MTLDGISCHCPLWVHTTAWTGSPSIRPFIPPDYPGPAIGLPVILIGRLAVHRDAEGKGIGTVLFRHALESSLSTRLCIGVLVEAIGEEAATWYERFGLRRLGGTDLLLFIMASDIRRVLAG